MEWTDRTDDTHDHQASVQDANLTVGSDKIESAVHLSKIISGGRNCHYSQTPRLVPNLNEVTESAKNGCPICTIIHKAVLRRQCKGCVERCSIEIFTTDESVAQKIHSRKVKRMRLGPKPVTPGAKRVPPGDTSSVSSLQTAKRWIEECTSTHLECRVWNLQELPTRVVDVGTFTSPSARLHESNGETGQYICLSHCWGKKEFLQLTTANLAQLKSEIPWSLLPKTFQDAISFTRNLGIRWIWIDSLCIIQDNPSDDYPSDWQKESAKMASIYSNSYLTLGATASADSTGGCFTQACHRIHQSQRISVVNDMNNHMSSMADVYARLELRHFTQPGEPRHPLLKRAWVYQERLLSTRMLHFAGYELHWECNRISVCECRSKKASRNNEDLTDPKHNFINRLRYGMHEFSPQINEAYKNDHEAPPREVLLDMPSFKSYKEQLSHQFVSWNLLIEAYTKLDLTYSRDIFPALSGLAREWNSRINDQYLAGLWKKTLLQDLCWHTKRAMPRPGVWRAPSWSWASVETPIETQALLMNEFKIVNAVEILEAECSPVGPDYAGELSSGHLLLSGQATTSSLYYWKSDECQEYTCGLMVGDLWLAKTKRTRRPYYSDYPVLDYPVWEEGPGHLGSPSEVQLLMIGQSSGWHTLKYLILIPSPKADGKFERVGYLEIESDRIVCNENLVPKGQWDLETDSSEWKLRVTSPESEPTQRDIECVGIDAFMKEIGPERYRQLDDQRERIQTELEHTLRSAPRRTFYII